MTTKNTTRKRLEHEEMYLTSKHWDKERLHVSVILNFMSKAHLLGYKITAISPKKSNKYYLKFTPVDPVLIERVKQGYGESYRKPWIIERAGLYAISMIFRAADEVVYDFEYKPFENRERKTRKKVKKK